jgi:hypothetical protein
MSDVPDRETSQHRIARRAVAPVAIAGLLALGATGWAAAASGSPSASKTSTTASPAPDNEHWKGAWGGGRGGHWGGWSGAGGFQNALHGDCVSAKPGGGTQTTVFQRGTVTDLSGTSVTVRSSDGYTQRYAMGADTPVDQDKKGTASLSKNKEVMIIALKGSGDPATQRVFGTAGH